jgi:hypothetical protein
MNPAEFEPAMPARERPQTNALYSKAIGIDIEAMQTQQMTASLNKIL